ncbi:hypothetical protein M378DRAFT_15853, partial [Amanita muscaria Koide BX008]
GKKSRKKFKKERGTEDAKVESDGVEGVSDIDTHLTQVIDLLTKLLAPSNWINASTPSTSSTSTASLNASTTSQSASTTSTSTAPSFTMSTSMTSLSASMTTKKTSTTTKTTSATVKTPAVMAETSATAATNTTSKTMKTTTKSVARTAKEKTTTSKTLNIPITSNTASKSTPSSSTATKSSMTAATVPIVPMITKPANSTSLTLRIPAIRTVPENPASSAAPVVAPKPKPVYRNKQFKIPQPHSVTIQEDQLDQIQDENDEVAETQNFEQEYDQDSEHEQENDQEHEHELEPPEVLEPQGLEPCQKIAEHERDNPNEPQEHEQRAPVVDKEPVDDTRVPVAGPSTTTINQSIEGGTNATDMDRDLFARDLAARLGRIVLPAEHKKAWRKLTNEQKSYWKNESKKLRGSKERKKKGAEDESR